MDFLAGLGMLTCIMGGVFGGGGYIAYLCDLTVRPRTAHFTAWVAVAALVIAGCQIWQVVKPEASLVEANRGHDCFQTAEGGITCVSR